MAAPHRRAARREREAAEVLGTTRVHRHRFEKAPDVERVQLPGGEWLTCEVKTRGKLPAWLAGALEQAAGYGLPGDVPLVVVSQTRGAAMALLPLRALARLLGIAPAVADPQPTLALA
jgi:hypothetical protein